MLRFRAYIKRARLTDTPEGDFIRDARADSFLPPAKSWRELRRYLAWAGAGRTVLHAAARVWRQYLKARG